MFRPIRKIPQIIAILIIPSVIFLTTCSRISEQNNVVDKTSNEVTLFNTEKKLLHSEIINDDFEIYISFST